MKKIIPILFICFALLCGMAWAKEYRFEYQKEIEISGKEGLNLSNTSGTVRIVGGPVDKVSIHAIKNVRATDADEAEKVAGHIEIKVSKTGNNIVVKTNYLKMNEGSVSFWDKIFGAGGDSFGSVDYDIVVPLDYRADVENISGDVTVSDLNKEIFINTTSGNLHVHNIRGTVNLESVSGDIRIAEIGGNIKISAISSDVQIDSIAGTIDIRSTSGNTTGSRIFGAIAISQTSGDIKLEDITGNIRVKSTSGKVYVRQDSGSVDIVTYSGDVDMRTAIFADGDYYVETGSGHILFSVPATSSGSINIETISGDIQSDMPLTIKVRSRNKFQGDFGEKGPEINLKTLSGDISFGQY